MKSAAAENQSNNASAAVQNPAGDIKAQAANDYEAAVNAGVDNASSDVASEATQNSAAQNTSAASSSAQASTASAVATQSFTVSSSAVNNDLNYASVFASLSAMPQANTAAQSSAASSTANNDEYSGYKDVTNAFELQNAVNDFSVKGVNVKGNTSLFSDLNINRAFTIHGVDGAVLNLGQNKINNNGQLTLADVTVNGSIMGNSTVNIKGTVTSNVNDINGYNLSDTEKKEHFTNWDQTKGYNIQASTVNIENGASLTINRASIGDGIHLMGSSSSVNVADNAKLTVNMNTNNASQRARYHDAGIFAESNGSFNTGRNSVVTFNTSIGQAISMTGMRPNETDSSDRFGGYHDRDRNNGSGQINLGQNSTMNFTGRDGVILGNNSNFNVGDYANVHFENKGRGVALDLAAQSNINIGDHAVTYFHSVGKTGTSGSYDGYNYIGVNEGGNITIGAGATFRVILEGRGDNPWDDVISLDSRNANTTAAFTSKPGAIIDIRDDNTNFYAELISFPLGGSNSRIDIQDPLMLNLQRYSAGGATTGWMATGGDKINTTSSQYTSNLIYMSGSNGVFKVSGGDYDPSNPNSAGFIVYQQIKSDGSKQIWLNVNDVNIPMNGFQTKDIWNNQANPDVSINGNGLTGKDAPYYGISTQCASQQIWIPHRTPLEITGNHTNTIKYVDEQGNEIFPENTSSLNLKRNIILDITQDQIKKIQDYALNHTADETLEYIKNSQSVAQDSGWKFTNGSGQTVTDPYATVESPKLDGYTATIQSTNVQGLKVGEDGTSVTAKFAVDPSEDIVQNGELSDSYKNDGITGIPDNYVTVVVYKKAAEKGSVKVVYHDDTTNTDIPNTEYNTGSVDAGTKVDYSTSTTISNLESQGYVYVTTDGTIPSTIEGNQNVVVTVHMKHGVQPVTPDTPTPDVPKDTPAEAQPDQLTKKVNLTVNYVNSDGSTFTATVPANAKQTATFTGTAYVDKVTGQLVNAKQEDGKWVIDDATTATPQITWTSDKTSFDKVVSPVEQNYHLISVSDHQDGNDVAAITGLTKDSGNIAVTVTYAPNGKIIPVGPDGKTPIPDAPTPQYPTDPTDPSKVTPNEPVPNVPGYTPSVPTVTPTDPGKDTPVPYTKPAPEDQTVDSKQTVHYIDGDTNTAIRADSTNGTFTFVKSGQTGQWNVDSHKFENVDAPVINGYVAERRTYEGQTSTPTDSNKEITIIYHKVGKIIPVDPSGNPIPDAPTPSYTNDPTDPAKVTPNEPVPTIPGYTPSTPTVTPSIPTEDTPVPYTPIVNDQTAVVNYVDQDNNNAQIATSGNLTGKPGSVINYSTADQIKQLEDQGYVLVSDGFPAGAVFDDDDNTTQTYTVVLKHGQQPVTPTNPGKPGEPINPNDPDGPKYPAGSDQVTKDVTRTIQYVDENGNKVSEPVEQTAHFTGEGVLDKVTGQWITPITWTGDGNLTGEKTPVVEGYHVVRVSRDSTDNINVDGTTVNHETNDYTVTVSYAKNGKIVPVDPSGKPIPNVPTPQYPTDPTDPSKVTPDEPVPTIPGYTPSVPTVTPTDPGKDTPVPYTPIVNDQTVVVNYVDQDNNNAQIATSGNLTGKPGSVINYSTVDQIKQLEAQGYVLVSDGFPAGAVFDNDDNTTQTYTVVLKHGTTTFKPDKPGTPGEPINPNYPDGPKVTNEDVDYLKDVKFTIHYVGAGNDNPADNVQNAQWTRSITVDNVTGKIISSTEWVSNKESYDGVKTPVVNGYHADRAQVDGPSVTMEDQEATVTYVPNGKIIPVDPNGNPIPDVPTPQYPTDPTDPTKVTPDEPVPTIPGYKPEVPTVTPTDPGVDTPVKYTPDTVNPKPAADQIAIVNYVDQDNNNAQIATSGDLTGKAGDKINYSTADQIKQLEAQGYVLVTDGFPAGATFDDNADQNQVFTVVLKHGHAPVGPNNPHEPGTPVNPDEPNGPKWPAKDTYTKEYTSTVHFVDNNGNKMRDDDVQTSTWTRTLIINNVTGQIINPDEAWTADKGSYNEVKVPVINGYVADKANVPAKETVQQNLEDTVTYTKVGNIVPVDPNGNPIPNVPAVPYTNDPTDPTKVVPNEPVPSVPGMTPNVTTVTPTHPTVDTPVVYTTPTPVTPETPVTPQPDEPATPETPATPAPATSAQPATPAPQAKTESAAPAKQAAKKLPQTGNENNSAAALGLAALGLTGLLAAGKKRRKED
ncbi:mucin-binding protein [Limosilactobacillus reuteri]|uniref:mucin-binding protein n=1 Tax=Limosilactobacillus reuteri TaxID=1598 RepID=UPI0026CD492E|nr:LPXTG cell wall anchor domain-containing protein [Limosilactobacillus reuteri]